MDLIITRYSEVAANRLRGCGPVVGHIHSCYDHIVNIQMPDKQLFTLQGPGLLQAPCAAALTDAITPYIPHLRPGALVSQGLADNRDATLHLCLHAAELWQSQLVPSSQSQALTRLTVGDDLAQWLYHNAADRGTAPVVRALRTMRPADLSLLNRPIYRILSPVLAARHLTPTLFLQLATGLVGLGEGLTPSGDDVLVGLLAVLHRAGLISNILRPEVRGTFLTQLLPDTTDLSAEFLRCALDGHFSEPMLSLMHTLYNGERHHWVDHAERLARIGHSSGVDALLGIVLGNWLLAPGD